MSNLLIPYILIVFVMLHFVMLLYANRIAEAMDVSSFEMEKQFVLGEWKLLLQPDDCTKSDCSLILVALNAFRRTFLFAQDYQAKQESKRCRFNQWIKRLKGSNDVCNGVRDFIKYLNQIQIAGFITSWLFTFSWIGYTLKQANHSFRLAITPCLV